MNLIKKIILLIVMFFPFIVSASEYSEWSMEPPKEQENITIKTEERYLYYEMVETNVEYQKYGESSRSHVDLNDFKLTEGIESDIPVEETEYTVVTKDRKALERCYDDVSYIRITHDTDSNHGLRIKDITLINEETNEKVPFELESFNNIVILSEGEYLIYTSGNILLKLDNTYNAYNLSISYTIVRDNTDTETKNYLIEYLHTYQSGLIPNFELRKNIDATESYILKDKPETESDWWIRVDYYDVYIYIVQEKLFKYYDLERRDIGYYTNLEGDYLKDSEPVTFYSYKIEEMKEDNKEEQNNNNSQKNEDKTNNNTQCKKTIEYNCEYLNSSSFPLDTSDDITDYSVNTLESEEDKENEKEPTITKNDTPNSLISYNTKSCEDCSSYKSFALISLTGVLVLVLIILISSLVKRIKTFND